MLQCVCVLVCICIYIYVWVYINITMCLCIYIYMFLFQWKCVCIYIYIYIYKHLLVTNIYFSVIFISIIKYCTYVTCTTRLLSNFYHWYWCTGPISALPCKYTLGRTLHHQLFFSQFCFIFCISVVNVNWSYSM